MADEKNDGTQETGPEEETLGDAKSIPLPHEQGDENAQPG